MMTSAQSALDDLCNREMHRVTLFRMSLPEHHPFWASLAYQMEFIMNPGMEAMACTDCHSRVWLNPEMTQHLSQSQLGFVLLHELGHVVYATSARLKGRDLHLFNMATDYKINEMVAKIRQPRTRGRHLYEVPLGMIDLFGVVLICVV